MNALSSLLAAIVCCCWCARSCHGWTQAELDLFDLVEEIGQNFYELLQIEQTASSSDVRKAYRRLSLLYHPDKNSEPDAVEKFRKIGAVAEVLRDEELRAMYDAVLIEGLPDWRQPIYYYRRVRKMSVLELSVLLLAIATIAQFLYGWAQYFEKWLVLNELLDKKTRREQRGAKARKQTSLQLETEIMIYEQLAKACIPHYSRLLPVVMVKKLFRLLVFFFLLLKRCCLSKKLNSQDTVVRDQSPPATVAAARSSSRGKQGRDRRPAIGTHTSKNETALPKGEHKDNRKRPVTPSQRSTDQMELSSQREKGCPLDELENTGKEDGKKCMTDSLGFDVEPSPALSANDTSRNSPSKATELAKKEKQQSEDVFPDISPVVRNSTECGKTTPIKVAKSKTYSDKNHTELADSALVVQDIVGDGETTHTKVTQNKKINRKNKEDLPDGGYTTPTDSTRKQAVDNPDEGEAWSQFQQQQLEWSLKQYSRSAENRWQLIAVNVAGKSEAECKKRYKMLVDLVHRKKRLATETH